MRNLLALTLGFVLISVCGAQSGPASSNQEVFAPFVSRLKARATEQQVTLTWRKSQDVEGFYLIYRSREEITQETFDRAEFVARIESSAESYTDYPLYEVEQFYAVLIEDDTGKVYSVFIPFRNKTTSAVSVEAPIREEALAAVITGLRAAPQGEAVNISFEASRMDRELMLFRSARPLRDVEDLIEAVSPVVLDPGVTSYTDRPIAGVGYYYAVVDRKLLQAGKVTVVPDQNALSSPVVVQVGTKPIVAPVTRARPLPRLLIPTGVEFGDELIPSPPFLLPPTRPLSPATVKAVAAITAAIPAPPTPRMKRVILDADRAARTAGADTGVREIVQSYFSAGKDSDTKDLIRTYLRIERSASIEARAHFYLGQIEYFAGNHRSAFMEFLLCQDNYYTATQPWLEACFVRLQSDG